MIPVAQVRCETYGNVIIDYVHELDILAEIYGDFADVVCRAGRLGGKPLVANPGLAEILVEAWAARAPKKLVAQFFSGRHGMR